MIGNRPLVAEDYLAILRRRFWILLLPAMVFSVGAYMFSRKLPRPYTSETVVLVNQQRGTDANVDLMVTDELNQRLATMQEQILSRSRLQEIAQQFHLFKPGVTVGETVDGLQQAIVVSPVMPLPNMEAKGVPGFRISVTMNSPKLAQQVCSTVTSLFLQNDVLAPSAKDSGGATDFLGKEVDDAKNKLDEQDKRLADFQQAHIGELPNDTQANLTMVTGLRARLDQVNREIDRAQQDKGFAQSQLTERLSAWQSAQAGQNPNTLEQQLAKMQDDLVALQARYTPDYPDVIRAKADIADMQRRIAQANASNKKAQPTQDTVPTGVEPPELALLRNQINQDQVSLSQNTTEQASLQRQIVDYENRIKLSPTVAQEFQELTRDQQSASDHYNDASKRRETASTAKVLSGYQQTQQFRVLDPASLPEMPSATFGMQFAGAGLGAGLFLGLLITLVLEYRDKSLRTEHDAEFFLEFPVVALVPQFKSPKNGARASSRAGNDGLAAGLNRVNSPRY